MDIEQQNFTFISIENEKHHCLSEVARKYSKQIERILSDSNEYEVKTEISSAELKYIIEFFKIHGLNNPPKDIPKPLPSRDLNLYVDEKDYQFISQFNEIQKAKLIEACNLLECQELLDLISAQIATIFIGMTMEELRIQYNIPEEYTDNLEEKLKKDHAEIFKNTLFEPNQAQIQN